MSMILTRDEVRHLDGYIDTALCEVIDLPVPFGLRIATDALIDSNFALHDALDAALERESAYRAMLHHVQDVLKELDWVNQEQLIASVGNFLHSTHSWKAFLAAVATPQGQEVTREDR